MNPKNYLILALGIAAAGGGALAWNQYQELIQLRAATLDFDERATLRQRAEDAERHARELETHLTAALSRRGDELEAMAAPDGEEVRENERPERAARAARGNGGQFGALRELMQQPEVQQLLAVQQKAALQARYAALFKNLNLTPAQADQLTTLLAEKQIALQDVMAAAREQGLNPRTDPAGFRQLVADAQADINNGIKGIIGDGGYEQLQRYDQTLPQRQVVNQLQQTLSYSNAPLTPAQTEQLVQLLASNTPQRGAGGSGGGFGGGGPGGGFGLDRGGMGGGGFGGNSVPITSTAIAQAQSFLSAPQVQALQQLQQVQQAQRQLQQTIRQATEGQGGGGRGARRGGN